MKITIIGAAGNVGSGTAFNLIVHRLADELVLIDSPRQDAVTSHALDLSWAATGLDILVRAGNFEDMHDSNIVIVAAGPVRVVSSITEELPANLPVIQGIAKTINKSCPDAVVITATNPVDPMNYAMYLASGADRKKIIGYANNDSIRFRKILAQALGVKDSQVEGTVIGEHGSSQVLLFSSVRVNGEPVSVSEEVKQKVRIQGPDSHRVLDGLRLKTGRTAAWTTAVGLTAMCQAIVKNTSEIIPCSAVLDGEYGCSGLSMGVPAVLYQEGIHDILEWELPADEHQELQHSINTLKQAMQYIVEQLGVG